MKILICSNVNYSKDHTGSGNWITSYINNLASEDSIEIVVVSLGSVFSIQRIKDTKITQVLLTRSYHRPYNRPKKKLFQQFSKTLGKFNPDVIHIWGTEGPWCHLIELGKVDKRIVVLSMQGVVNSLRLAWFAGLSFTEVIRSSFGFMDFVFFRKSYAVLYYRFSKYSKFESKFIGSLRYVIYQSNWVKGWLKSFSKNSPSLTMVRTNINMRENFKSGVWKYKDLRNRPLVVSTTSSIRAYKGLHITLKALSILVHDFSLDIKLQIIGVENPIGKKMILRSGYENLIIFLLKKFNIASNVNFLGTLDSAHIKSTLLDSDVFVQSSFVESYSVTLAEAMYLGVPSVVAYSAALPELGGEKSSVYYSPGDHVSLANKIFELTNSPDLMKSMSKESRKEIIRKTEDSKIVNEHINLYTKILKNEF